MRKKMNVGVASSSHILVLLISITAAVAFVPNIPITRHKYPRFISTVVVTNNINNNIGTGTTPAPVLVEATSRPDDDGEKPILDDKQVNLLNSHNCRVILPGERLQIKTDNAQLIHDSIERCFGVMALGFTVDVDDVGGDDQIEIVGGDDNDHDHSGQDMMLEMASMCEMKSFEKTNGVFLLDLQCVGRFQLTEIVRDYPFTTTRSNIMVEHFGSNQTLNNLIADNIEALITKITTMEERLLSRKKKLSKEYHPTQQSSSLHKSYEDCYETAINYDITPYEYDLPTKKQRSIPELVAMSWAVFSCMKEEADLDMNRYRLRAFGWDKLDQRLILGQYMLREKVLKVQGHLMKLQDDNDDDENEQKDKSIDSSSSSSSRDVLLEEEDAFQ